MKGMDDRFDDFMLFEEILNQKIEETVKKRVQERFVQMELFEDPKNVKQAEPIVRREQRGQTGDRSHAENRSFAENRSRVEKNRSFAENRGCAENRSFAENRGCTENRSFAENGGFSENRGRTEKTPTNRIGSLQEDGMFYEIEYGSTPFPGVGKFVQKPQKIEKPERDEIRERFNQMRDIARNRRSYPSAGSRFFERRAQQESAEIFYEQGMFMKDFEDDYPDSVPYSSYYPCYQMMGYEQLRTYFTWRTKVRKGMVAETSLSFAYLYLYELLGNIGVENPQDGLEKLLFFWKEYRSYEDSIDKYLVRWLKDYHIYYELPVPFAEFVKVNGLEDCYPQMMDGSDFSLYCAISKYDIRKSAFYQGENVRLIQDCFQFTIDRMKEQFAGHHMNFEEILFRPTKNMAVWSPFPKALFWPWKQQRDRRIVFSENEVYVCRQNRWSFSTVLTADTGKHLIGYVMKQMESVLRRQVKYRHALTANRKGISPVLIVEMAEKGIPLAKLVTDAVTDFYREATRTVVKVDPQSLAKIRREALETQEKLIVPETEEAAFGGTGWKTGNASADGAKSGEMNRKTEKASADGAESGELSQETEVASADSMESGRLDRKPGETETNGAEQSELRWESPTLFSPPLSDDPWAALAHALTKTELDALHLIADGEINIRRFADSRGIMLEVLLDGINEKAMDHVGDSLLDEEGMIYEDYMDQVKEMVEGI